eukprot:202247-Hanusia_phi.AAC.1
MPPPTSHHQPQLEPSSAPACVLNELKGHAASRTALPAVAELRKFVLACWPPAGVEMGDGRGKRLAGN